jgi:hypothetical protein
VGVAFVVQNIRISIRHKQFLQIGTDLLEQLAELEWLREQVRQAEVVDAQTLLTKFKAHRKSTEGRRSVTPARYKTAT